VEHKLSPQIAFLVDTLRDMGRHWPVAGRYCELLQRVLDEHADSERALGTTGERITPSSVKILADMRRTAFDLDILISRQPRHLVSGGGVPSRLPSVTPAPNELEYLDVFDFFNVPRLPFGNETAPGTGNANHHHQNGGGMNDGGTEMKDDVPQSHGGLGSASNNGGGGVANEFNITNFMVDANSDWLFHQS